MSRLSFAAAVFLLAASACSLPPSATSSAATTARTEPAGSPLAPASGVLDAEVAMPQGFPADFPIYPHARLTAAAPFASAGQTAWGMEWESTDVQAKVEAFYTKQLNQGDWVLTSTSHPNGAYSATFARKSDKNVQGTVGADWNATLTKILVSLVGPG
jgi:hypothetical protein